MPKLIKFFLSNKKLFLFLLITYNVHLFAIITGYNFNFKFTEETKIKIKLLNKKEYLEKDLIKNPTINKDNIIFSSKEEITQKEIIEFLKTNYIITTRIDDLDLIDDLNKNKFIVDYYNEKYKNKMISYIYFVKEDDNFKKVLLFWNIDTIKKKQITIETEDLKKNSLENFLKNKSFTKNLIRVPQPLYYQNKKIDYIYFDIKTSIPEDYSIEILLNILSSGSDSSYLDSIKKLVSRLNRNNKIQEKIFFFYS